ncbi:hypothetical protein OG206_00140 [Streptomyces sp. NBC_01341]|uniref:hypothetical protein n=1 Tax=Streptomyces sp. NBC_01341 TaxID=2903831 RepID=UPI002E11CF73|nr:hypothetical protein OG206_00140 [Streptomyces sp. NBC_01341]
MSTPTLVLTLALFVVLLLVLVSGLLLAGVAYVTHRHPRLEKPLGVAGSFAGVLIAAVAVLIAVVALTAQ